MLLTSSKNPKIQLARTLWKRREREQSQLFLIEGFRELTRAILGKIELETLFICPELFLGSNEQLLIEQIQQSGTAIFATSPSVFRSLSYRDRPDGLLAIAKQFHRSIDELRSSSNALFIVAEGIEKPGNLGTILRSSDGAGVHGVIVCDRCTDIYNPNVVRSSVGTLFTIPVVETEGQKAIRWLKKQGIAILAATPSAKHEYTRVDLTQPIAIAVGTEQFGLSQQWMEEADLQVKIPMHGVADSLNVAMATTLLLYEAVRQRGHGTT